MRMRPAFAQRTPLWKLTELADPLRPGAASMQHRVRGKGRGREGRGSVPPLLFTGRMPRSGKRPVLNLLTGQKSGYPPRRGDSLHRFTSNLAWPTSPRSAWLCKTSPQSAHGVGMRPPPPKYQKFPLFGKESPRRGEPLDRFLNFFRGFYTPSYPTLVFHI